MSDLENSVYERAKLALARQQMAEASRGVGETSAAATAPEPPLQPTARHAMGPASTTRLDTVPQPTARPSTERQERVQAPTAPQQTPQAPTARLEAAPEPTGRLGAKRQPRPGALRILQMAVLVVVGCMVGLLVGSRLAAPPQHGAPALVQVVRQPSDAPPTAAGELGKRATRESSAGIRRDALRPQPPEARRVTRTSVGQGGAVARGDTGVRDAVERWRAALLSNDPDRIAPAYAARVDRYFLQSDVNRAFVRQYMQRQEASGTRLRAYRLSDFTVNGLQDGTVEVSFVADFAVSTRAGERTGHARTQLKLREEAGSWRIFSERDFRS